MQQRKNSWQDGVSGTNCPIPPGQNFTYHMQAKDQIGSFFYFPSLAFHKAAGGFGAIHIRTRPRIPVPIPPPADEYTLLIGDWYTTNHKVRHDIALFYWLWLVLIFCERKVRLASWWLVLIWCERKTLLLVASRTECKFK